MLENTESLLPILDKKLQKPEQAAGVICVGCDEDSTDELEKLLDTLGLKTVKKVFCSPRKIIPATFIGKGKIDSIKEEIQKQSEVRAENGVGVSITNTPIEAVILDMDLSPNQLKNLENALGKPVLDRSGVIIEIFSRHARTKEAKTQVELARLNYILPRLTHFWSHFERQRGGMPGSRGMGEKQIEVDRRLVKRKISILEQRLKAIGRERVVQRSGRKSVLKVAIVGYTNAGKSTLLNALTHSAVGVEDKLFATLDASVRSLDPNSHPPIVAIDTVGFIDRLPPTLVASFRSTLEELQEADLLLHVVDASHREARKQFEITEKILEELDLKKKPRITILNKADCLVDSARKNQARMTSPGAVMISALMPEDISKLREIVLRHFRGELELWEVVIPYGLSKLDAQIHKHGSIEVKRHYEKGTFYRVRIGQNWAQKLGLSKFKT